MTKIITLWEIIMKQFNPLVFISVVEAIGNVEGQCLAHELWMEAL
jgi:hypothetical protein